jgi:hypothetical protein
MRYAQPGQGRERVGPKAPLGKAGGLGGADPMAVEVNFCGHGSPVPGGIPIQSGGGRVEVQPQERRVVLESDLRGRHGGAGGEDVLADDPVFARPPGVVRGGALWVAVDVAKCWTATTGEPGCGATGRTCTPENPISRQSVASWSSRVIAGTWVAGLSVRMKLLGAKPYR